MERKRLSTNALTGIALAVMFAAAWPAQGQTAKTAYPAMAPLEQYLMPDRNEEIKLARSAAPDSIASEAEILVLGKAGYETAVQGKNGFVCLVERSWTAGIDSPDFWNPKLRGPICLNPPAARTYLPQAFDELEVLRELGFLELGVALAPVIGGELRGSLPCHRAGKETRGHR